MKINGVRANLDANRVSDPYRDVIYIGVCIGEREGRAWRLVLACGHAMYRPFPTTPTFTAKLRYAPRRVRCTFCGLGREPADLDAAIELGKRLDQRGELR